MLPCLKAGDTRQRLRNLLPTADALQVRRWMAKNMHAKKNIFFCASLCKLRLCASTRRWIIGKQQITKAGIQGLWSKYKTSVPVLQHDGPLPHWCYPRLYVNRISQHDLPTVRTIVLKASGAPAATVHRILLGTHRKELGVSGKLNAHTIIRIINPNRLHMLRTKTRLRGSPSLSS